MGSSGPLVPPSKYAPSAYRGYTTAYGCVLASYTGAGLTPKSIDFTQPKQDPQNLQNCYWYVKIENRNFVPVDKDACDWRIATALACDEDPVVAQLLGGGRVAVCGGIPSGFPLQPLRATVSLAVATLPGSTAAVSTGRTVDARLKER
jgi:hypothetical protein